MTTHFLTVPGGRIAYADTGGPGPLVVCTPGLGDDRSMYRHVTPLLTAAGYRVVGVDLRGQGESTAVWDDYGTEAIAGDLRALVRELAAGPAVLVANSFTGGAAVVTAVDEPALVRAVVLNDSFVRTFPKTAKIKAGEYLIGRSVAAWLYYWDSLYPTRKPADHAAVRAALKDRLREPGRMAAIKGMLAAGQRPCEERLPRLAVPVQVVMGTKDPVFPPDPRIEAEWIAAHTGGRVAMIEGAGHYPMAEFPQQTAELMLPFLAEVCQDVTYGGAR
ncbi:alpha/beta fold hydrolase [Kitasatospora sp. McL0602]|uniref:alpha/beta fold hydrolase n=1 Tax=Kitasatospora sp. McL0602 TaxID=3439530 RepID=UPI003F8BA864